jgi:hypothetical protein
VGHPPLCPERVNPRAVQIGGIVEETEIFYKEIKVMKKLMVVFLIVSALLCVGCGNRRISLGIGSELNYSFAAVYSPDGAIVHSGALDSWKDHEDATVDLWFEDGYKFLAHSMNVVMSNKPINN